MESSINQLGKGLNLDLPPEYSAKGYHSFALNMVNSSSHGVGALSNERGNTLSVSIPGMYILGYEEIEPDVCVLFLVSEDESVSEIGIYYSKKDLYDTLISDASHLSKLGFSIDSNIDTCSRIIHGCERIVYFVDGINPPRSVNIDRIQSYYSNGGLDVSLLSLQQYSDTIPSLEIDLSEGMGNLASGQYFVSLQYWDEAQALTDFLSVTEGIILYPDSVTDSFYSVTGSSHSEEETYYSSSSSKTSKAISVRISGLDQKYRYYRLALICANNSSGTINKTFITESYQVTQDHVFLTSTDGLEQIPLGDIIVSSARIKSAKTIATLHNRLILANIKEHSYRWHLLQQHASKIKAECFPISISVNEEVVGSFKDPKARHKEIVGYTPGEIYSFGVVYVLADGTQSPVFHIPGSSNYPTSREYFRMSDDNFMDYRYTKDWYGALKGSRVRHHRFPTLDQIGLPIFEFDAETEESTETVHAPRLSMSLRKATHYKELEGIELEVLYNIAGETHSQAVTSTLPSETDGLVTDHEIFSKTIGLIDSNWIPRIRLKHYYTEKQTIEETNSQGQIETKEVDVERIDELEVKLKYSPISGSFYIRPNDGSSYEVSVISQGGASAYNKDVSLLKIYGIEEITLQDEEFSDDIIDLKNNRIKCNSLGIRFYDIEVPNIEFTEGNPVIGYYIVRNERTQFDMTVLDYGVLFPTVKSDKYTGSGLLLPETNHSYHSTKYDKSTYSLYSLNSKFNVIDYSGVSRIDIVGSYKPLLTKYGHWLHRDVVEGTSRQDDHQRGDDDGWCLVVNSRNNYMKFSPENPFQVSSLSHRVIDEVREVNALEFIERQERKLYNIAVDNKSVLVTLNQEIDLYDETTRTIPFCVVRRENANAYQRFESSPYFLENSKMAPISQGSIRMANGDYYTSTTVYHNHIFFENRVSYRAVKHKSLWQYGLAGLALVAGALGAIFTAGTSLALAAGVAVSALATTALLASSGIKMDNIANALYSEYNKGLRRTTIDSWVYYWTQFSKGLFKRDDLYSEKVFKSKAKYQFRRWADYQAAGTNGYDDDAILWFVDAVSNLYLPTFQNVWLRSELNTDAPSYAHYKGLDSPQDSPIKFWVTSAGKGEDGDYIHTWEREPKSELEKISFSKLLFFDKEKSKYKYRGLALGDFWYINKDYQRLYIKPHFQLPKSYEYNSKCIGCFPNRIVWSNRSLFEDYSDSYRIFKANNYKDLSEDISEIENIFVLGNQLHAHTRESLYKLPSNFQEKVTSEYTLYVGTGEFLSLPEQRMGYKYELGINTLRSTLLCRAGYFFYSDGKVYGLTDSLKNLSDQGLRLWFEDKSSDVDGINKIGGNACVVFGYDNELERLMVSSNGIKIGSKELIGARHTYSFEDHIELEADGFHKVRESNGVAYYRKYTADRIIKKQLEGSPIDFSQSSEFTLSYSFLVGQWVSCHSYNPYIYLSLSSGISTPYKWAIYRHGSSDSFCSFYGKDYPFVLEYSVSESPLITSTYDFVRFGTKAYYLGSEVRRTFNKAVFYNSRQSTGEIEMRLKSQSNQEEWYMSRSVEDENLLDYNEGDYSFNQIRNSIGAQEVSTPEKKVFRSDKRFSSAQNVEWTSLELLRDKYMTARLIYDQDNITHLIYKYGVEFNEQSVR